MTFIELDLEEIYSSERKLNRERVQKLISLGLEGIIELIKKEPIEFEFVLWNNKTIMEIIGGIHGCEYAKALYNLSIKNFSMKLIEKKYLDEIIDYNPIKLKDVPLLDEHEFMMYQKILSKGDKTISAR
ncbi:MAG: hypothetical protein V1815_01230 [Candidatus Woesearchaeota archaeon]